MKSFNKKLLLLLLIIPCFFLFPMEVQATEKTEVVSVMQDENISSFDGFDATIRNCKELNIREAPTTSSNVLSTITYGEYFKVLDQTGKWFKIQYQDISGFVFWNYVSFIESEITEESNLIGNSIIHYTSSENRDVNIAVACSTINGITLNPGDEFRWSKIIGQTTAEKGYLTSTSIIGGNYVDDIGGGVCQVSTTIYNSLFDTSMIVTERHKHSKHSNYSKNDATVAHGSKDFAFINSYDFPIKIETFSYKGIVFVNLYKVEETKITE